jgi:FAD/FMN-containing dehydrogenase
MNVRGRGPARAGKPSRFAGKFPLVSAGVPDTGLVIRRRTFLGGGLALAGLGLAAGQASATGPYWARLRTHLTGDLVLPGDAAYPVAKQLDSGYFDTISPQGVAYCETVGDVRTVLSFAQHHDLHVAVRSGGHNAAGWSTTTGLVLDTSRLRGLAVGASTVSLGPGTHGVDAVGALSGQGLAVVTGSCPTVCAGGYLQGGGFGPLSRKHGMACDRLVAAEVVLANGSVVRADADTNPDLYWALRGGGGGNFGVVTRFEVRPIPVTRLPNFVLTWPFDAAASVIAAYQDWMAVAPDDLEANVTVLQAGPAPTVMLSGTWQGGDPAGLTPYLDALVSAAGTPSSRTVTDLSYRDAMMRTFGCADKTTEQCHRVGDNPEALLPRHSYGVGRGRMIGSPLTSTAIDEALTAFAAPGATGQFRVLNLSWLAGRVNRVPRTATAYVHRNTLAMLGFTATLPTNTPTPEQEAAVATWTDAGMAVADRYGNGENYQNTVDSRLTDWRSAYYKENYPRLVRVKRCYDPAGFFRFPQAVGA